MWSQCGKWMVEEEEMSVSREKGWSISERRGKKKPESNSGSRKEQIRAALQRQTFTFGGTAGTAHVLPC